MWRHCVRVYAYEYIDKTRDMYSMVLSHYQQQQYERALEILHKYHVLEKSIPCRHIAALCAVCIHACVYVCQD